MADEEERKRPERSRTLLLALSCCLEQDEELREAVLEAGFAIPQQTIATLNPARARACAFLATTRRQEAMIAAGRRPVPLTAQKQAELEAMAAAIAAGPVLAFALEQVSAHRELQQALGRADADEWAEDSLRGRFGDRGVVLGGLRGSEDPQSAAWELDFFFGSGAALNNVTDNAHAVRADKTDRVALDVLSRFLFPPHLQHPRSSGRLIVFGLYGPLDPQAQLRAGLRGMHVVTDRELDTMCDQCLREDILAVYTGRRDLSPAQEEELLAQADHAIKHLPQVTLADVQHLFADLEPDADGLFSFHEMQAEILLFRRDRIKTMKLMFSKSQRQKKARKKHDPPPPRMPVRRPVVAPPSMFRANDGVSLTENANVTSELLSKKSFQITSIENGNDPGLTQNVRMLRDDFEPPPGFPPWDGHCCDRGTQKGSRLGLIRARVDAREAKG